MLSGESGFANVKPLLSSKFCESQSSDPTLQPSMCSAHVFDVLLLPGCLKSMYASVVGPSPNRELSRVVTMTLAKS